MYHIGKRKRKKMEVTHLFIRISAALIGLIFIVDLLKIFIKWAQKENQELNNLQIEDPELEKIEDHINILNFEGIEKEYQETNENKYENLFHEEALNVN